MIFDVFLQGGNIIFEPISEVVNVPVKPILRGLKFCFDYHPYYSEESEKTKPTTLSSASASGSIGEN